MIAVIIVTVITTVIAGGIRCNRKAGACGAVCPYDLKGVTALGQSLQVICM